MKKVPYGKLKKIKILYYFGTPLDFAERIYREVKELLLGVDCKIFYKTIEYYKDKKGIDYNCKDALRKAKNKKKHKDAWFKKERDSIDDVRHFYKEVDIYLFRQPFLKRLDGFRRYREFVSDIPNPRILEYGCGSAVVTEWLMEKFPECYYTVADIPSLTLDFVNWKKKRYNYKYNILEIGKGKEGIPLEADSKFDLIICKDVLEHTPNPLEIVEALSQHLSVNGILVTDFLDAVGGENLIEAGRQRESVKEYLKSNLFPIKEIDDRYFGLKKTGNDGIYIKIEKDGK